MHVFKPVIWKILKIYKCLTKNDAKPRSNSLRNDECVCFYLSSEGIWAARAAHSRDWDLSWEPIRPSTWKACRQKHEHNRDPLRACSSSAFLPFLVIFFSRFAMFSSPLINDSAVVIADPESRHSHFVIVGTLIRYVLSKVLYFTLINHIVFSPLISHFFYSPRNLSNFFVSPDLGAKMSKATWYLFIYLKKC